MDADDHRPLARLAHEAANPRGLEITAGRTVERGTHESLMHLDGGFYRRLVSEL